MSAPASQDFGWLIGKFVEDVPGVTHGLLVSLDGLQLASSANIPRDLGDQMAAISAGLISMADRSAALFRLGASEYVTIRITHGHLLLMRIGDSAGLTVVAEASCDLRIVAYHMTQLVGSVGHMLTPQMRTELQQVMASRAAR